MFENFIQGLLLGLTGCIKPGSSSPLLNTMSINVKSEISVDSFGFSASSAVRQSGLESSSDAASAGRMSADSFRFYVCEGGTSPRLSGKVAWRVRQAQRQRAG